MASTSAPDKTNKQKDPSPLLAFLTYTFLIFLFSFFFFPPSRGTFNKRNTQQEIGVQVVSSEKRLYATAGKFFESDKNPNATYMVKISNRFAKRHHSGLLTPKGKQDLCAYIWGRTPNFNPHINQKAVEDGAIGQHDGVQPQKDEENVHLYPHSHNPTVDVRKRFTMDRIPLESGSGSSVRVKVG